MLYEIWMKYESDGKIYYNVPLCDYLESSYHWIDRNQVVSLDKSILEKTLEYLKLISPEDLFFDIREKHDIFASDEYSSERQK
jgi:hypothetical protein